MTKRGMIAAGAAILGAVAYADFEIELDFAAKPIKDIRTSTCGPEIGYAGCNWDDDTYLFDTDRVETARAMKAAGAWFQRMWSANGWFARRKPNPYPADSADKEIRKKHKNYRQSNPEAAFRFWKENRIKVLFTLEAWHKEQSKAEILEFVKWIVDNGYKDVVAGFELGNESFFSSAYPNLAPVWTDIVNEIWKIWPKVPMGICLCELFERNPDLSQVRGRMLAEGSIKKDSYFAASDFNRYSTQFVVGMSNCLDKISHVIYHAYGAESPYSCSYYGFQRFRNYLEAMPELKGKKMWLSEVRPRSDEDNRCQRIFRETLIMSHYALMAICQPEMDGFNHHQIPGQAGGIYRSTGKSWNLQWRDAAWDYPDYRAPYDLPHYEIGSMGVAYRIYTESLKGHPLILDHGTSREQGTEDTFFTSARVCDQVYARRRALKEGRKGFLGLFGGVPEVEGEVEWTAITNEKRTELCLLMVSSKGEEETVTVRIPGRQFAAPTYRAVTCPEEFVDNRDVPGEGKAWRQLGWEDTQSGYDVVKMAAYEGMEPACDELNVRIKPHTVQSVTVMLRNVPKAKGDAK